jgi:hypothetical protein
MRGSAGATDEGLGRPDTPRGVRRRVSGGLRLPPALARHSVSGGEQAEAERAAALAARPLGNVHVLRGEQW